MCLFYNKLQYYIFCYRITKNSVFKCKLFTSAAVRAKSFEEIPGPKSLPIIGTLYQYLPFLGESRVINQFFEFLLFYLPVQVNINSIDFIIMGLKNS